MMGALQNVGDLALSQATAPQGFTLGARGMSADRVEKTAKDFEGMFMTQMLQPMFQTVEVDPEFGGGHGEEVMRSFLVQEYGKMIAKTASLGIADAVKSEMIRAQERLAHPAASTAIVQPAVTQGAAS